MGKIIIILAIALAFVAGTMVTGTMANAASNAQGQPFQALQEQVEDLQSQIDTSDFNVDSFFDVFFEIDVSSQQCPNPNEIPKINPDLNGIDCSSDFVVDSFFDIFYDIEETSKLLGEIFGDPDFDRLFGDPDFDTIGSLQETDEGLQFQIDSFFDVFFDASADGDRNTIEPLIQLFGDPDFLFDDPEFIVDSFFDISVVLDERDRHFDTEIVSMQLRGGSPLTVSNIGSSGEDGVQIALPKGSLQSQIDRLDLRIAELEDSTPETCEECDIAYLAGIDACGLSLECQIDVTIAYNECASSVTTDTGDACSLRLIPRR